MWVYIKSKLLYERVLNTGEPCTCEYVTLLQSFHRGTLSIRWYIAQNFQPAFSMSIMFRRSKFKLDFCNNICRTHTVWGRSKTQETQNFLNGKFSASLKKDFIFQFHIYLSTSFFFFFNFLFSYTYSQTSMMISINIEMLNSGENRPLQTSLVRSDVAISTFRICSTWHSQKSI